MRILLAGFLFLSTLGVQAQIRAVVPAPASGASRVYSPGVDAGDYLYVSGQGPLRADGSLPATFAAQVRQALDNVRSVVQAAGLTMEHVVYTQVYLEDISKYQEMKQAFADAKAAATSAQASGTSTAANAASNLASVGGAGAAGQALAANKAGGANNQQAGKGGQQGKGHPSGGKVPDDPAAQVDFALDRMKGVLEAAGLDLRHMVFVNPYLTADIPMRVMNQRYAQRFEFGNTPARATIEVSSLPGGAHIEYTGVAVRDLKQRRAIRPKNMPPSPTASPCVFAGETLYCSAKSGFIPGAHGGVYATTTAHQLRQTMRNLLDNLEEADMNFDEVVATNAYLDDLSDLPSFDEVHVQYFSRILPARTTIAQIAPAERKPDKEDHYPDLEQVSFIAVRHGASH